MGETVVRLSGVVAGYGAAPVLSGAHLEIRGGEHVALLGPNGSGKTTLLRVVAGTLTSRAGEVELFGRPIGAWDRGDLARAVTILPQGMELPAGFTVAEVVAFGRIPHARSWFATSAEDEAAVGRAMVEADVDALADRRVESLSGGERQRVLLALALAQEPRLLLLDEPTAHLDIGHQLALIGLLERLRRIRGLTVLAVLHDLNLAQRFADRTMLLDAGRVVPGGGPDGRLDLGRVRDVFGVAMVEAITSAGDRVLAPAARSSAPLRNPD
jgi:ABC-type cobalamin/Fe3+-siderophores transport system ATPase subunit